MLEFKLARALAEKDEAFKIRYRVFCEECDLIDKDRFPDNKERDKYDSLENTAHFLAVDDGKAVGTVRLIGGSSGKPGNNGCLFPIEEIIQIGPYKSKGVVMNEISRSCVLPRWRKNIIMMNLWKCTYLFAKKNWITHFCTTSHPKNVEMYGKIGFYKIGEEKSYSAVKNNPAVPLLLVLAEIKEPYKSFFEKKSGNIDVY